MKWLRVGIDLAPASMLATAPGTAKLVAGQAKALLAMDVPWTWVPVFSNVENPLRELASPFNPLTGRQKKFSIYASFELGSLWRKAGCALGFSTAYFVPFGGASLLIYPSAHEGYGLPPMEAMGCGCAAICADNTSLPEVVTDASHRFDASSPDALIRLLRRHLDQPLTFNPSFHRDLFDRQAAVSRYIQLIREVWEQS